MLYKALLDLKVWPAWNVIKVDDTEVGIAEGINGGAWTVGVSVSGNCFGLSREDTAALASHDFAQRRNAAVNKLERAGAHHVVDSVADLMPVVQKIEERLAGGSSLERNPSAAGRGRRQCFDSAGGMARLAQRFRARRARRGRALFPPSAAVDALPRADRARRRRGSDRVDGWRIFDFHGNSVHQIGHGHPKVVAAIRREMDTLPFSPRRFSNATATALAQRLVETAPGDLDKVLFAPSGAAAISMALKLARYATGGHKTLSLWDSFHGANLDAIGVGGEALFRRDLGPMIPGAEHLPPLNLARRFFGDDKPFERFADYIDYVLEVQGDVSALIAEPLRWTTVEAPPPEFWPRVKDSCARHGALLIFDEIPSCLARTGALHACEQLGATPDILVIGKGLGGGIMPLAAIPAPAGSIARQTRRSDIIRTRRVRSLAPLGSRRSKSSKRRS